VIKQKTYKVFFAAIFSLALLFPLAIQAGHALDGHEHQICYDFSSHIHKKSVDCSICDFHFSILDFQPLQLQDFLAPIDQFKGPSEFRQSEITAEAPHFFLRGPPLFS